MTEETPTAPTSLHGAMHLAREVALRAELRVPVAMLRPTLIYGAADPHNGYGPNRFCRLAAAGKEIVLFGEGEERRDHVAIGDVPEIAVRVLKWRSLGTLNVASGEVHSFRSVAEMAVALATKPVPSNRHRERGRCRTTAIGRSTLRRRGRRFPTSAICRLPKVCALPPRA